MIYYVETNLIAIIVGTILLLQGKRLASRNETSQIILNGMLRLLVLVSISDITAFYSRGRYAIGVELANVVYFIIIALAAYLWFLFILVALERTKNLFRAMILTGIPILILCVAIAANPLTHFFFSVDENILYHRGTGVLVTWIIEWSYILAALVVNIIAILHEKRSYKKTEYLGYVIFMVPIAAASVCQMLFYGTTTAQIGFMVALLLAFINKQHFQVQKDDLTGLNNRNAFMNFRDSMINRSKESDMTIFMLDLDKFKLINDRYGHIKGDQALKDTADVLKRSVGELSLHRVGLYRYGGDEFIIIGTSMSEEEVELLKGKLNEKLAEMNRINQENGEKYQLLFSIGSATMACADVGDFDELTRRADEAMYQAKNARKAARGGNER